MRVTGNTSTLLEELMTVMGKTMMTTAELVELLGTAQVQQRLRG
jgi:hypothetical protein